MLSSNRDMLWAEAMYYYKNRLELVYEWIKDITIEMESVQQTHNMEDPLESELSEYLSMLRPSNWDTMSTLDHRSWYMMPSNLKAKWYSLHGISKKEDRLLSHTSIYEFITEFMGIELSNPQYIRTSQRASKLIANMKDWKRMPTTQRLGGRCRVIYERVANMSNNTVQEMSTESTSAEHINEIVEPELPF